MVSEHHIRLSFLYTIKMNHICQHYQLVFFVVDSVIMSSNQNLFWYLNITNFDFLCELYIWHNSPVLKICMWVNWIGHINDYFSEDLYLHVNKFEKEANYATFSGILTLPRLFHITTPGLPRLLKWKAQS